MDQIIEVFMFLLTVGVFAFTINVILGANDEQ